MRWRILAGVVTATAIVAKIGEVAQIAGRELPPQFDGGKHGAISFAIAAGVADFHEAPSLLDVPGIAGVAFSRAQLWPPLFPQFGRKQRRWPCQCRRYSPGPGYSRP